jgi:pyridoxine 4-dehydrogenase
MRDALSALSHLSPRFRSASRLVLHRYNVGDRKHEDVLEYCKEHGIAFIPWYPVAAGKLAQPGGNLDTIAKRHGATVAQLSIAWLLYRSPVTLPIPGTSSVEHLEENMKSAAISWSDAELKEIEKAAEAKALTLGENDR